MVSVNGAVPVMAIIEHAGRSECRMRSMNAFDVGDRLDFPLSVHGTPTIELSGTVVNRKQIGPRYSYVIALRVPGPQAEALVKATQTAHGQPAGHTPDVHTGNGLTRSSVRVSIDAEMYYAHAGSPARVARATNISAGGVLMKTGDELPVGASLELRIPLDGERLTVHGRIVAHQRQNASYNIAFYDMTHEARELIARFVQSNTPGQ